MLKSEVIAFTPAQTNMSIVLEDSNLQIKSAMFWVVKPNNTDNLGTGQSDAVKNFGQARLGNPERTVMSPDYCIYAISKSGTSYVTKLEGYVKTDGFVTPGLLKMRFDKLDTSYTVFGIVFGE